MRKAAYLSMLMSLVVCYAMAAATGFAADDRGEPAVDPQLSLDTAIPATIDLLEKKEYEAVVRQFLRPVDLKKIMEKKKMEEVIADLAKGNAANILKALRACRDIKPRFEDDGNTAIYDFKEKIGTHKNLKWQRIEGRWYIAN